MKREYILISSAVCVAAALAFKFNILAIGSAAADETQSMMRDPLKKWSEQPTVFGRFATDDLALLKEQEDEPTHCIESSSFQSSKTAGEQVMFVDFCAPKATSANTTMAKGASRSAWQLPKSPKRIIWQQEIQPDQRLRVELVDADRLPWPARFSSSRMDNKETIQIVPAYDLPSNREMHLVAKLFDAFGNELASWVLPLVLKSGSDSKVPWNER